MGRTIKGKITIQTIVYLLVALAVWCRGIAENDAEF